MDEPDNATSDEDSDPQQPGVSNQDVDARVTSVADTPEVRATKHDG